MASVHSNSVTIIFPPRPAAHDFKSPWSPNKRSLPMKTTCSTQGSIPPAASATFTAAQAERDKASLFHPHCHRRRPPSAQRPVCGTDAANCRTFDLKFAASRSLRTFVRTAIAILPCFSVLVSSTLFYRNSSCTGLRGNVEYASACFPELQCRSWTANQSAGGALPRVCTLVPALLQSRHHQRERSTVSQVLPRHSRMLAGESVCHLKLINQYLI